MELLHELGNVKAAISKEFAHGPHWQVTPAVQQVLDHSLGQQKWKEVSRKTVKHIVSIAPYAHASKMLKTRLRRLLSYGYFTRNLGWAGCWTELHEGCLGHLQQLGASLDRLYHDKNLGGVLGSYRADSDSSAPTARRPL